MSAPDDKLYLGMNRAVLECVPRDAARVLDLGCGTGTFAEQLKRRSAPATLGVTYSAAEAEQAARHMDEVRVADLNTFDFKGIGDFDCVVMSHVLEHLYHPADVLARLRCVLRPVATLVIALPNVLMWKQRIQFLRGRFRYQDFGLMDRTHYRFFDSQTAAEMVRESGYTLLRRADEGHFPLPGIRRLLGGGAAALDRAATRRWPGLFADQFILIAGHAKVESA
jgi:2-polyprenyl-3-methyl-5-hydroxy-6-metoxy-1,4-benzoquinol methylase